MEQKDVWEILADSWTNLRVKPYEEVVEFSKTRIKEPVLDIGCGNCRNLVPFLEKGRRCIGLDFSEEMVKISEKFLKKRGYKIKLKVSDMARLPFKSESIGTIICNSAIHALTRNDKLKALSEMKRVMKKDSRMLLSVWYRYQRRLIWKILLSVFKGGVFDVLVVWNYHGKKYRRFYHLYSKGELRKDIEFIGLKIEKIWVSNGNLWVVVKK